MTPELAGHTGCSGGGRCLSVTGAMAGGVTGAMVGGVTGLENAQEARKEQGKATDPCENQVLPCLLEKELQDGRPGRLLTDPRGDFGGGSLCVGSSAPESGGGPGPSLGWGFCSSAWQQVPVPRPGLNSRRPPPNASWHL